MNVLAWNYRGLNNKPTSRAINNIIVDKKLIVLFLLETKLKSANSSQMYNKMLLKGRSCHIFASGFSGSISCLWNDEIEAMPIWIGKQSISLWITKSLWTTLVLITGVY